MTPSPPYDVDSEVMWYAIYMTKNKTDNPMQVVIRFWCNRRLPFRISQRAIIRSNAVSAFIEAYSGGKKSNRSTFGILTLNNTATTHGTTTDTTVIRVFSFLSFSATGFIILPTVF